LLVKGFPTGDSHEAQKMADRFSRSTSIGAMATAQLISAHRVKKPRVNNDDPDRVADEIRLGPVSNVLIGGPSRWNETMPACEYQSGQPRGLQRDHADGAKRQARLQALHHQGAAQGGNDDPGHRPPAGQATQQVHDVRPVEIPRIGEADGGKPTGLGG